ncbi:MAG: hypothetical protein D3910_12185 [Candidatus Electrothrix sp. ATG2]|nr:hypothetical protein [Candidatus Electrothrix sp. ATG2]
MEVILFHSEDPTCVSYQKALGVADAVQKKFGDQLRLEIHKTDSELARAYNCRGSIAVFVNGKMVPIDVATSQEKMGVFLDEILTCSARNGDLHSVDTWSW